MKRPKIKEMNPLELARFRLLQMRRKAQRGLRPLVGIDRWETSADIKERAIRTRNFYKSVIAVTKPSSVSKAQLSDCETVMQFISASVDDQRQILN